MAQIVDPNAKIMTPAVKAQEAVEILSKAKPEEIAELLKKWLADE